MLHVNLMTLSITIKDKPQGNPLLQISTDGDLYPFSTSVPVSTISGLEAARVPADVWHRRLGHLGSKESFSFQSSHRLSL